MLQFLAHECFVFWCTWASTRHLLSVPVLVHAILGRFGSPVVRFCSHGLARMTAFSYRSSAEPMPSAGRSGVSPLVLLQVRAVAINRSASAFTLGKGSGADGSDGS